MPSPERTRRQRLIALLCALPLAFCAACTAEDPPHMPAGTPIILIVIDTLRADHLSCYGYEMETSPEIDRFANGATLFESNSTQVNTTFASLTSTLTGLYSKNHGSYVAVPAAGLPARENVVGIAERLVDNGYQTMAVISHPYLHLAPEGVVPFPGWQQLSTLEGVATEQRVDATRANNTNARAFQLLDQRGLDGRSDEPLLMWVHYFDPHTDGVPFYYDAPLETRNLYLHEHLAAEGALEYEEALAALEPAERTKWIRKNVPRERAESVRLANGRALYDAEIRYCDTRVGELFARLKADGLFDDALIAVLADHGENLEGSESGHDAEPFTHHNVFEAVSHVPLLIKLPGQTEARRITTMTQSIDLMPTVLELLAIEADPPVDGTSLVPILYGTEEHVHERVFTESSLGNELGVRSPQHKLIHHRRQGESRIFDLRIDQNEELNIYDDVDDRVRTGLETWARDFAVQAACRFKVIPGEGLAPLIVELRSRPDSIIAVEGPSAETNAENNWLRWTIEPSEQPVEICVLLDSEMQELSWHFMRAGDQQLVERISIGGHPLQVSTAVPLLNAMPGPPTGPVEFSVVRETEKPRVRFELSPSAESFVEMTLRYRWPKTKDSLRLVRAEGWKPHARKLQVSGNITTAEPISALVNIGPGRNEVLFAPRIDGHWPARNRVLVDGDSHLPLDDVKFVFTAPPDERLQSLLSTAPAGDPQPGSIQIWSSTIAGGKLDAALLDPEAARALHALGYVDDDSIEGR